MASPPAQFDRYGNPLSTPSPTAARHYSEGIDHYLDGGHGFIEAMQEATAADDGFALAEIALARFNQFRGRIPEANEGAKRARELVAGASRREQQHVDILATAIEGRGEEALARTKEHLQDFPTDAFILSQSSGVYSLVGFSGHINRNDEQLALLEPLAPAYGDDWWYLCNLAFAENELFLHDRARTHAERSLELHPRNGHGAHTLAHIHFETGQTAEGAAFLADWRAGYDRQSQMHGHLAWHDALFELIRGNLDTVDQLYHNELSPGTSTSAAIGLIADAASLLWRRDLAGEQGLDDEWSEVAEWAGRAFPRPGVMFADVHCAFAYAAAGEDGRLGALIDGLRKRAADGKIPGGDVVPAIAEAINAFAHGDYRAAVATLEPRMDEVVRIGGSHAQREVVEDTLLEAYCRAGFYERAEKLLVQRTERRPSVRDDQWLIRVRGALSPK